MEITIRRILSDKIGTHYGVYLGASLIHYEFCRTAAEKIANELSSGMTLYELLYNQINKECARKNAREIEQLQIKVITQAKQIEQFKKTASELEATNKAKEESCNSNPLQLDKIEKREIYEAGALSRRHSLSQKEADELKKLLTDMKALDFTWSSDLSRYITDNKLGEKYPCISGIVQMQDGGEKWDFEGGFPQNIYRIICEELNLESKHTSAQVIGFKPYKDV